MVHKEINVRPMRNDPAVMKQHSLSSEYMVMAGFLVAEVHYRQSRDFRRPIIRSTGEMTTR